MDEQPYLPDEDQLSSVLKTELSDLPPFPVIVTRLLELTRDQNGSIGELVQVVETDPAITARLLRIANSSYYSFQRQISTVRESIIVLGFHEVRRLALNLTIHNNLVNRSRGALFDQLLFWRHSLAVAIIAKKLADETQLVDPEEAYVAGLLHDIGKSLLEQHGKISYSEFLEYFDDQPGVALGEEQRIIGASHDVIGALYASHSALPDTLVNAILFHHRMVPADLDRQSTNLVAIVALADFIAWSHGFGSVTKSHSMVLPPYIQKIIDIRKLNLGRLVTHMDKEITAAAEIYHFQLPQASELRVSLLRLNIDLAMNSSQSACMSAEPGRKQVSSVEGHGLMLVPHRSLDRAEIINSTLRELVAELELQQVALLLVDSKERQLMLQNICIAGEPGTRNCQVGFDLNRSDAMLGTLREGQVERLAGDCEVEQQLLSTLHSQAVTLIPVTGKHHVVGMLALSHGAEVELAAELTDILVRVGQELGIALEHAKLLADSCDKAERDGLTGLPNRTMIDRVLAQELQQAEQNNQSLAVAMIDIDFFKKFNDTFGHATGDAVLKLVGKVLRQGTREGNFVGRYGGEEFCAILPGVTPEQALNYCERLRHSVEKIGKFLERRFEGQCITISLGAAIYRQGDDERSLLDRADQVLYKAKQTGRNRVESIF
ncbi:HDOD domain-containing protein [Motiliproteus coralliicola]|uniref:diguanylate cyclase n=1 Tax=Motiliproteus coralliicola TaxID=2283196 RepID=A0A369WC07_9GAMM|nr:HDOD domain-containing protein [Motiliproteus coralliicola]RDE18851.1 HDOD domain-containing protein [Motiliproteus coralliicola]